MANRRRHLAQRRKAVGYTQEQLAEQLGVERTTVIRWEAGAAQPQPWQWPNLADALKISASELIVLLSDSDDATPPSDLAPPTAPINAPKCGVPATVEPPLGVSIVAFDKWDHDNIDALAQFLRNDQALTADTAQRLAHEWRTVNPPQIVEIKAGRRVGARLAQVVTERVDVLRHMDDFLGGGDMHDLVRRELQVTLDMVRDASYTEQTGRRLLTSVGELAQLAGWVASDAGLHARAERYYLGGVVAAHAAKDEPLAGNLLSSLAYQMANVGDPREAVLLAATAYQGAEPTATSTTRAMLLERLAWANARFGDIQATERTLGQVDEAFTDCDQNNDPDWTYWLSREEIDVMSGRCLTQLKRPDRAIELLTQAVNGYDDTHARELALYLSWLAEAHIYARNIEAAAAYATRALRMSTQVTSARSVERIQLVRGLLMPYRGNSAVDEFESATREAVGRRVPSLLDVHGVPKESPSGTP
jgi:DNA-binding XRE family transcriptional regulator/tetratricopeptide (TPR) repeat protein